MFIFVRPIVDLFGRVFSPSISMTFHCPSVLCLSSFMFFVFFVEYCVHYVHCAL